MRNMNIFGGQGYLTDEQRKKPLQHGCEYFTFESCIDLSKPIRVIPYGNATEFSIQQYSRDVASFVSHPAGRVAVIAFKSVPLKMLKK